MAARRDIDGLGLLAFTVYLVLGGFLVLAFAWMLAPAVRTQNESACRAMRPEPRAMPAPELVAEDLAGNTVSLADFRGKLVVVNFWATYCEPCITEWPQLDLLAERAVGDDVVVLAVSIDEDKATIAPFLERMSLGDTRVVVLWDPTRSVHTAFGTTNIPDTYFVDERGQLTTAFVNVRKWGSPGAYQCVRSAVGRS
jgi:thiol-disulfide isomerase/thioredoxin